MAQPIRMFTCGNVSISVFENSSEYGGFHTCSISVKYKDGNTWKYTQSFRTVDSIVVQRLMSEAIAFMLEADGALKEQNRKGYKRRRPSDDNQGLGAPTGTKCSDCHELQYSSPGGITCPNGHGGAPPLGEEADGELRPF